LCPFVVGGGIVDNYCLNFRFIGYYKPNSTHLHIKQQHKTPCWLLLFLLWISDFYKN